MASKSELNRMKMIAANVVSLLLVLLLSAVALLAITGFVNLESPAVSVFVGNIVGQISGLLAPSFVWYFGHSVQTKGVVHQNTNGVNGVDHEG